MEIAYFDTIGGISGDMTLGAFVSAGMSIDELAQEIDKLDLKNVELQASHVERNGIVAVKVDVIISGKQEHRRGLFDIFSTIDTSSLSDRVKRDAKKIFMEVATAEAAVHGTVVEKIHFHEVGALDSIVDIVGAAICFEKLGIDSIYSSPVKLGHGGMITTEHGTLPLPGPATTEILRNYPIVLSDIPYELTTPTGAAIIKAMSAGTLSSGQLEVERIGYGAGTRDIPQVPNLLRVLIGKTTSSFEQDEAVLVETNIDDMNPEIYPFVIERLLGIGALDAFLTPVIMKKGRLGMLLSTLTNSSKLDDVLRVVFSETTTIGVRIQPVERRKASRAERTVTSSLGIVKIKSIVLEGREIYVPEFEECKRIALEKNMPLRVVYETLNRELLG
jgi:uncharacterized protein (TIGR00299 family) protein